jgi:hypothetical protein
MTYTKTIFDQFEFGQHVSIDSSPEDCPHCGKSIEPICGLVYSTRIILFELELSINY